MTIKQFILDGWGSAKKARVLSEGEQLVSVYTCPPLLPQKNIVFSQKVTDDGLSTGSDDLGVDGSSGRAVNYWIPADSDNDRYISKLSFICGYGSSAQLWEFADANTALTNGIRVFYTDTHGEERTIMNPKSNYGFQRASLISFSRNNWEDRGFAAGGDYGWLATIPLDKLVPPFGIKLDRGTNQKLTITIRDDCRAADLFNCNAFGFERFE